MNIIELKKMLTNQTIMKKVEKIFNKRLQSKPNVIHQSTKIIQELKSFQSVSASTSEMANKKNVNLKSIKKKKILNEIEENEEFDIS